MAYSAHPAPFNCAASRSAQFVESVDFFKGGVLRSGDGVGVGAWGDSRILGLEILASIFLGGGGGLI